MARWAGSSYRPQNQHNKSELNVNSSGDEAESFKDVWLLDQTRIYRDRMSMRTLPHYLTHTLLNLQITCFCVCVHNNKQTPATLPSCLITTQSEPVFQYFWALYDVAKSQAGSWRRARAEYCLVWCHMFRWGEIKPSCGRFIQMIQVNSVSSLTCLSLLI